MSRLGTLIFGAAIDAGFMRSASRPFRANSFVLRIPRVETWLKPWAGSSSHLRGKEFGLSHGRRLLINVIGWQARNPHSPIENFLFQRKGNPFLRRIGIGPQTAKLQENFLFVLCHPLALE
jgi:hypothetical protein